MARAKLRNAARSALDARAVVERRTAKALEVLHEKKKPSDDAVHAVRKELKRARAALRLLREAIGEAAYSKENIALRDVSRPLAPVRDSRASLETVRHLIGDAKERELRAVLVGECRALREERKSLRGAVEDERALQALAHKLEQARERIGRWRMPRELWPVLRDGIERVYRKGRKALAKARSERSDENLHEARKQVKYFGAVMKILRATEARRVARLAKRADSIAERLGRDHDLALVRQRFARAPGKQDKLLLDDLGRRRKKLQKKALKRAQRLYHRKPGKFVARLERSPLTA
jgi:CHAD domain-containing protein